MYMMDTDNMVNFNPLPSCEGRLSTMPFLMMRLIFQSTPLMRGETIVYNCVDMHITISIHSPHARGDKIL